MVSAQQPVTTSPAKTSMPAASNMGTRQPLQQPQVGQPPVSYPQPQLQMRPMTYNQNWPVPQQSQIRPQYMMPQPQRPPSEPQLQANPELKLRPVVPQPGSTSQGAFNAYPSPAPSPFRPIAPTPTAVQNRPGSIDLERRSSLEDMLESVENSAIETPISEVLQPKIMTPGEIEEQKIEAQAKEDIAKATEHDPYSDDTVLSRLKSDMEDLEFRIHDKVSFDSMWRELNVAIEKDENQRKTISIARCYPMKNRLPDVLPYDHTRVELPTTKDDYINASHIRKNLPAHSPRFIATQSPTTKTLTDFWTMVWQESVETMVCLIPELDFTYWPQDRKEPIRIEPDLEITLQSTKTEAMQPFVERIFTVMNKTSHTSRVVIHLQLNR